MKISKLKVWLIAIRPFSLSASTMPVIFGSAIAAVMPGESFSPARAVIAFFAMVILHSGANILSDYTDFKKGIDKVPTPVSGAIVRGLISPREGLTAAWALFAAGSALGLVLVYFAGWPLLVLGGIGVAIGVLYTLGGPISLKYHGLGDLAVFLNFGVFGSLGAWIVQTGCFSWLPAIWAVPMSLLVVGILHSNNWRDTQGDTSAGFVTVASILGDRGSLAYYGFLIFGPFIIVALLVFIPGIIGAGDLAMPRAFAVTLLTLPMAVSLWKKALQRRNPKEPFDFIALDGATAQFNMMFGLACAAAVVISYFIR